MIDQLRKDRVTKPALFSFFGGISPEKLDIWLRERKLVVPTDLRDFWCETGGGDLFESRNRSGSVRADWLGR